MGQDWINIDDMGAMLPEDMGARLYALMSGVPPENKARLWSGIYEKLILPRSTAKSFQAEKDYTRRAMDGFAKAAIECGDSMTAEYISRVIRDLGLRLI